MPRGPKLVRIASATAATTICKIYLYTDSLQLAGIIIIIIIIERKDLGGIMSKDCKDTLQTLKTVTKRECDAK